VRSLAHQRLRRAPREDSLNTTGLVHEAYRRFVDVAGVSSDSREHFLALGSRGMRARRVQHRVLHTTMIPGPLPHHSITEIPPPFLTPDSIAPDNPNLIDLCPPIERKSPSGSVVNYFPLVRNSLGLVCGIRVLFLRREPPGRVYQGGDIDGRLKTLFDALAVPQENAINEQQQVPDDRTFYCLLEDDALITAIDVKSEQLLGSAGDPSHVRLAIEVDVRVAHPRSYNSIFSGERSSAGAISASGP
jgi:ECF sigma factor